MAIIMTMSCVPRRSSCSSITRVFEREIAQTGTTQLRGHAHFLEPTKIYMPVIEGNEFTY